MIIECPQCQNRYLVPDSAIGAEGRTVRCANCRHSWFQSGIVAPPDAFAPPVPPSPLPPSPIPPAPPSAAPAAEGAPVEAASDANRIDPFAHEPPFRPHRNPARRATLIAAATGLLLLACIAAILWLDTPSLGGRLGLNAGDATTPLRIVEYPIERRDQPNGSELFAISGRIVNPTDRAQRVPNLRAELHDAADRIVFTWTVRPEVRTLAPRDSLTFNSAQVDPPPSARKLVLSFAGTER